MEVLNLCATRSFERGALIFEGNQPGNEFYIVRKGTVAIQKDGVVLSKVGEGGHFGEMAIMDKGLRSADAVARTTCQLLEVPRKALFSLMRTDNELAVKLLWCFVQILNRRLRSTNQDLLDARHVTESELTIPSLDAFEAMDS
jgi:CRP-like cAMP-binding protein